jgi:hypothetical protein
MVLMVVATGRMSPVGGECRYSRTLFLRLYLNWITGLGLDLISGEEPSRHRVDEAGFYWTGTKAKAEYKI